MAQWDKICEHCQKTFYNEDTLQTHIEEVHTDDGVLKFVEPKLLHYLQEEGNLLPKFNILLAVMPVYFPKCMTFWSTFSISVMTWLRLLKYQYKHYLHSNKDIHNSFTYGREHSF